MSTPDYIYPIIVPSDSNVEDAFSSTNTPDYTSASPDYSPASPGNTSSDPSEDLSKDLLASLAISPFHDDPYMKVFEMGKSSHMTCLERHEEQIETILNHLDELPLERIEHMEDKIEGPWLDNQYGSYPATNGIETSPRENLMSQHACYDVFISGRMAPKRTSTSAAPAMTQAAIRKLVAVE
ncbi:hypothetical protein Tco_0878503 [Tanacetum coccineum]|uniref:Uncharacterized protein n=1 Tax=Tanacetum coccineum TaxID=301880 RepID=A0ABQ5C1C8_9ASTR